MAFAGLDLFVVLAVLLAGTCIPLAEIATLRRVMDGSLQAIIADAHGGPSGGQAPGNDVSSTMAGAVLIWRSKGRNIVASSGGCNIAVVGGFFEGVRKLGMHLAQQNIVQVPQVGREQGALAITEDDEESVARRTA